jgi:CheY-like chemotaxis protein
VIVNLVVNARDAMPNGGHLTITTQHAQIGEAEADRDLPPGSYVLLEVVDDGIGMEPATLSRVFEPFFTTKEFGKGTGLGLATVYGIVQQMGGAVRVTSTNGEGATFSLFMPAVDARAPEDVAPAREAAGGAGGTILLVEDDTAVRTFLEQSLERQGYHVLAASGWDDALALIESRTERIRLLITDVMIPGGTGPDLAVALAKRRPDVPVLYMSGFPDSVMAGRGAFPKATHYLQKPFSAGDLLLHVSEILSRG